MTGENVKMLRNKAKRAREYFKNEILWYKTNNEARTHAKQTEWCGTKSWLTLHRGRSPFSTGVAVSTTHRDGRAETDTCDDRV